MSETTAKQSPIKSDKNRGSGTLRHPLEYAQFVRWIATPEPYREIKKQEDFARSIGLHQDTLTDWKKREGFWDDVKKAMGDFLKDKTPNALAALYKKILGSGSAPEVKLWLQYVEGWREEQVQTQKFDEPVPEADRLAWERIKRKHARRKKRNEEASYPL